MNTINAPQELVSTPSNNTIAIESEEIDPSELEDLLPAIDIEIPPFNPKSHKRYFSKLRLAGRIHSEIIHNMNTLRNRKSTPYDDNYLEETLDKCNFLGLHLSTLRLRA